MSSSWRVPTFVAVAVLVASSVPSRRAHASSQPPSHDSVTIVGESGDLQAAYATNTMYELSTSVIETSYSCTNGVNPADDEGLCYSPPDCDDYQPSTMSSQQAKIVSVSCDLPGCTATDEDNPNITVQSTQPGVANVTVTMKDENGNEFSGSSAITFTTPTGIAIVPDSEFPSPQGSQNALFLGQIVNWCGERVDASGNVLDNYVLFQLSNGSIQVMTSLSAKAGCFALTAVGSGTTTIAVTGNDVPSRMLTVEAVDAASITSLDLVSATALQSPTSIDQDVISPLTALTSSFTVEPDPKAEEYCHIDVAARFHTADGLVGLAPASDIFGTPANVLARDAAGGDQDVVAGFDVQSPPTPGTIEATIGALNSSISIDTTKCAR